MGGLRYNLVADIDRYPFGIVHFGSPNRWRLTHIGPLSPRQTALLGYLARQLIRHRTRVTEFARASDVALVFAGVKRPGEGPAERPPRKVSHAPAWRTIVDGQWQPVMRHGKYA